MSHMQTLDLFRSRLAVLKQSGHPVHVSITQSHPKITLVELPVRIKHVSAQLFVIERLDGKLLPCTSYQYADLLTRRITIHELNEVPFPS